MLIAAAFLINSAGNFVLGVLLSAILGPAEFGRYATVALAGLTLAGAVFDWLRLSTIRFAGDAQRQASFAASLEAANLAITLALFAAAGLAFALRLDFGLGPLLLFLTPLYTVAISRIDYSAAQFRARDLARPYALIFGLRQLFCFLAAAGVAWLRRDAATTVAALAIANLAAAVALGPALRVPGATLAAAKRQDVWRFFLYAKPLVASFVLYALISLINRQVALAHLGAAETGKFALAFDMSQRLFQALYALPEIFLFQHALKLDREQGRAAAEAQLGLNAALALAAFLPVAAGYFALGPTFEQLIVPQAYRGDFARISLALAPGLICYGAIVIAVHPVFQLAQRTWPVTAAALLALVVDAALLIFGGAGASVEGLAHAYSASLVVAAVAAGAMAFRRKAVRPSLGDLAVLAAALVAMVAAVRPINALASPWLAAAAGVSLGGSIYLGILLACDFAGSRSFIVARLRARHRLKFGELS
jgi:O-antigen/teichoic acid export membrane protein